MLRHKIPLLLAIMGCLALGVWLARNIFGRFRAVKVIYRQAFEHDRPYEREFEGIWDSTFGLLKLEADLDGTRHNVSKGYMEISQTVRWWNAPVYVLGEYSGGLGLFEGATRSTETSTVDFAPVSGTGTEAGASILSPETNATV